ncbi:MAG: metallopeptidase family protein [Actinomycetota bacterium]|nr:metallopeptidase family protein [Actinomycetota bacterium]
MLETLRPILRAAAIAGFTVGLILFLINPPSLSGFEGLLVWTVGIVAVVLMAAWATVSLIGRDAMTEEEVERLAVRAEDLARRPPPERDPTEFDLLVAEALDGLPPDVQELLSRVPVIVSHRGREFRAYGHHYGGPYTRGDYEHRIVIYQDTLERDFGHDPELLAAQVERTVRHEVAHHIGYGEPGVRGLGL